MTNLSPDSWLLSQDLQSLASKYDRSNGTSFMLDAMVLLMQTCSYFKDSLITFQMQCNVPARWVCSCCEEFTTTSQTSHLRILVFSSRVKVWPLLCSCFSISCDFTCTVTTTILSFSWHIDWKTSHYFNESKVVFQWSVDNCQSAVYFTMVLKQLR
jgi:hypothetical protein